LCGNTDVQRWVLTRRREFDRRVTRLVLQAEDEGDLRTSVDEGLTTKLLFGMINSITEWYRPDHGLPAERLGDAVVAMVLDGLRSERHGGVAPAAVVKAAVFRGGKSERPPAPGPRRDRAAVGARRAAALRLRPCEAPSVSNCAAYTPASIPFPILLGGQQRRSTDPVEVEAHQVSTAAHRSAGSLLPTFIAVGAVYAPPTATKSTSGGLALMFPMVPRGDPRTTESRVGPRPRPGPVPA
jgi:hypothetical protein